MAKSAKEFSRPEASEAPSAVDYMEDRAEAESLGVRSELLTVKREIEFSMLNQDQAMAAEAVKEGNPRKSANVLGVGIGSARRDLDQIAEEGPGTSTLNVYVAFPAGVDDVRRILTDDFGQNGFKKDKRPVNIITCGIIEAQQHMFEARPVPCGVSISNANEVDAGTLGFLARGRGARADRLLAVTNNHVIARLNQAAAHEDVTQPGRHDKENASVIGQLERFVPLDFVGGDNLVDCACAWVDADEVRPDHVFLESGVQRFFRVGAEIEDARRDMVVGKSGRTTGLTSGRIIDVAASIRVRFGGKFAQFRDVIAITALTGGKFTEGGDSGSLVWTYDDARRPVGLHFAGGSHKGDSASFSIPIRRVLDALDVDLYLG